jgi:hypothetical protein
MGYETTALFIEESPGMPGYSQIIAMVELSKVCDAKMAELIGRDKSTQAEKDKAAKWSEDHSAFYNEGEYTQKAKDMTPEKRSTYGTELYRREQALAKKHNYVFHTNHNRADFLDPYGDFPSIVTVKEFLDAMEHDNKLGTYKNGYRRFNIAIAICKSFLLNNQWDKNLKVMLWGH